MTQQFPSVSRIEWAEAQIAEQDKIIADSEARKAAALKIKADLEAFLRIERQMEDRWVDQPFTGALLAASDSFEASRRGAKKRAILTILNGLNAPQQTSTIVMQLPAYGITGATVENTSPQLSGYKSDELVDLVSEGWQITDKGRAYLAEKN